MWFFLLSKVGQIVPKQTVEATYSLPERKEEKRSLQGQDSYFLLRWHSSTNVYEKRTDFSLQFPFHSDFSITSLW
jgi:hypothetical protein